MTNPPIDERELVEFDTPGVLADLIPARRDAPERLRRCTRCGVTLRAEDLIVVKRRVKNQPLGQLRQYCPDHAAGLGSGAGATRLSEIDVSFDVRTDAGVKDPDSYSRTLRQYHRLLWSKPLPNGQPFVLDERLRLRTAEGDFWLASDGIVHTYQRWTRPARLVETIKQIDPAELTAFYDLACTVGAFMVFPLATSTDGPIRQSVNQRRGTLRRIADRFDLTLECIRLHYLGLPSPLGDVLARDAGFFGLFGDFEGYVEHFLLNDLINSDHSVRFFKDFDNFHGEAVPSADVGEYREYMRRGMTFNAARNERIARFAASVPERLSRAYLRRTPKD